MANGKYRAEIESFLFPREKLLLSTLVFQEHLFPYTLAAAKLGCSMHQVHARAVRLLRRLQEWQEGRGFSGRPHPGGKSAHEVRRIIAARLQTGETIPQIVQHAHLISTEQQVLELYILGRPPLTARETARKINRSVPTVFSATCRILNKLQGRDPYAHLKRRYLEKSDRELHAIALEKAKTRRALFRVDLALGEVLRDRGLLDTLYPRPKFRLLKKLEQELRRQLRKRPLRAILTGLNSLEQDIITRRALAINPMPLAYFRQAHGIQKPGELDRWEARLIKKLKGTEFDHLFTPALRRLQRLVQRMSRGPISRFRSQLNARERQLLRERVEPRQPKSLAQLSREWDLTREAARQTEKKLLKKLETYCKASSTSASASPI